MRLLGLSVAASAVLLVAGCSSSSASSATSAPATSASTSAASVPSGASTGASAASSSSASATTPAAGTGAASADKKTVASAAEGYFHALAASDVAKTCSYVDASLLPAGAKCVDALKEKLDTSMSAEARGGMDKLVVPLDAVTLLTPTTAEVAIGKTQGMTDYAMSFNNKQIMQWTLKNGTWLVTGGRSTTG